MQVRAPCTFAVAVMTGIDAGFHRRSFFLCRKVEVGSLAVKASRGFIISPRGLQLVVELAERNSPTFVANRGVPCTVRLPPIHPAILTSGVVFERRPFFFPDLRDRRGLGKHIRKVQLLTLPTQIERYPIDRQRGFFLGVEVRNLLILGVCYRDRRSPIAALQILAIADADKAAAQ